MRWRMCRERRRPVAGDAAADGVELADDRVHLRAQRPHVELVDHAAQVLCGAVGRTPTLGYWCRGHGQQGEAGPVPVPALSERGGVS